jgi:hypothetical protein
VPTLDDRGCRVVSATDPHGSNLGFLDPKSEDIDTEIILVICYLIPEKVIPYKKKQKNALCSVTYCITYDRTMINN